ncbi:hypothetical protein QR685DRAFT_324469 [Neurospora intermedia]|uniref:Uncharacterized protein n=1 Tax=Neurospora intermedia TaxID=5142 RepID=A0ABR3D8S1_NEUIN
MRREVPNGRSTLLQNQEEMRACRRSATFLFSPSLATLHGQDRLGGLGVVIFLLPQEADKQGDRSP